MHIASHNRNNRRQLYRFTQDYGSGLGVWKSGEVGEFDQETVDAITRDVGGHVILEEIENADYQDVHDGSRHPHGYELPEARGGGGMIDRANFRAVRG